MVIVGGGQHGSTPRVISVPTQKGQQVRTQVCAPSHLLPCWLRSGVEPSQVAGGSERNCLDGSADDVAGGGVFLWVGREGDFSVIIRYSVMIEIFSPPF